MAGDDFEERNEMYGNNRKPIIPPKGYFILLWSALEDFTMRILLVASVVSIIIEVSTSPKEHRSTAWIEGFAILVAVMVCANVTAINVRN